MRAIVLMTIVLSGCTVPAWSPPPEMMPIEQASLVNYTNPVLIPISDPQCAWEAVVDVVDDYFKIQRERPMYQIGGALAEGTIETFPEISPTMLEPWRRDTAGEYDRMENTLQTMRRYAVIHMLPAESGYWVDVAVFKELEDLARREHSSAGSATFRYDSTFSRVINPLTGEQVTQSWIPKGRDPILEQRIIGHLISNCNEMGYISQANGSGPAIQGAVYRPASRKQER
jgi:hypothetical protein